MPIYLCRPGADTKEPWRRGVQVHARPFPIDGGGRSSHGHDDDDERGQLLARDDVAGSSDSPPRPSRCLPEQAVVVLCGDREEEGEGGRGGSKGKAGMSINNGSNSSRGDEAMTRRRNILLVTMRRYLIEKLADPVHDKVIIFCSSNSNNNNVEGGGGGGAAWVARGLMQDGFSATTLYWRDDSRAMSISGSGDNSHCNEATIAKLSQFINSSSSLLSSSSSSSSSTGDGNSNILIIVSDVTLTNTLTAAAGSDDDDDNNQGTRKTTTTVEEIILRQFNSDDDHGTTAIDTSSFRYTDDSKTGNSSSGSSSCSSSSIAMVINIDLHTLRIQRYKTRLHLTSGILVSIFFLPPENKDNDDDDDDDAKLIIVDGEEHGEQGKVMRKKVGSENVMEEVAPPPSRTMAGELVDVLRAYKQHVPRELLSLAPPPLLIDPPPMSTTPPFNDAIDDDGVDDLLDDLFTMRGRGGEITTTLRNRRARRQPQQQQQQQQQPVYHRSRSNQREASNYSSEDDSENEDDHSPGAGGAGTTLGIRHPVRQQRRRGGVEPPPGSTDGICRVVDGKVAAEEGYDDHEKNNNRRGRRRALYNSHHIGRPVRRIKHSELVLVDQALRAYGRTWLRLRWPGEKGGFGGFVALGKNVEGDGGVGGLAASQTEQALENSNYNVTTNNDEGYTISQPTATDATAAFHATTQTTLLCQETGVNYPTSALMKLLPLYDDGLQPRGRREGVAGEDGMIIGETLLIGSLVEVDHEEPVFCRICREGLHDVDYGLETPTSTSLPQLPVGGGVPTAGGEALWYTSAIGKGGLSHDSDPLTSTVARKQQEQGRPHTSQSRHLSNLPPIVLHHPTAENPLLAPCDCTGTMAFVHYLCIEQWRCRSRHPGARNGLNCETCGAEYTLPPPPSRPTSRYDIMNGELGVGGPNNNVMADDEWLDAMPPHVLAALRRPHPAWQFSAAVIRRRWLRPVVPILVSPLVALYCRARRTLKKRGVSRRRWACSLCRRRARWKCVRCLRSYYCSRQCQNVSWHIVHKHVCYKPQRFWWSLVVYTILIRLTVPKLVENFPIYVEAITLVPVNFHALGIIGGGIASTLKRIVDIRGRILELIVVTLTLLLTCITSGLVQGYFGDSSRCWGILASSPIEKNMLIDFPLRQMKLWYLKWDSILSNLGIVSHRLLCVPTPDGSNDYSAVGCFPSIHLINPEFYLDDQCSADMSLVIGVGLFSLCVFLIGYAYRQLRGARRNNDVVPRGHRRPHEE